MNKDQAQGTWEEMKGRFRKAYGQLTDDDFESAKGSTEKLYGLIQGKFGDAKDKIMAKIEALGNK